MTKDKSNSNRIQVTQISSSIGCSVTQKGCLIGLGLTKINSTKTFISTSSIRGMLDKVKHLVDVKII